MKLYKFRPLANQNDFNRAKRILETGCFWCSQFSDLNDPMEGVFTTRDASLVDSIYSEKNKYKICSFSANEAFENPMMWGYYANGFKGIAIEIEVDEDRVEKVNYYVKDITDVIDLTDANIAKLLRAKVIQWEHEKEHRFLKESKRNYHKIGEITAVYFGDPYGGAYNRTAIFENSKNLKTYDKLRDELMKSVETVGCYYVAVKNGKVVIKKEHCV